LPGDVPDLAEAEPGIESEDGIDGKRKAARRSKRKRRAREARRARRERVREPAGEEPLGGSESGAAEETTGAPGMAADEPSGTAEAQAAATADTAPVTPAPEPAGEAEPAGIGRLGAEEPLSQVPSRESVKAAMERVFPEVRACVRGKRGVAEVVLKVKNTGRVSHAVVGGDFTGTPEGSCIARVVRKVRLPAFLRPSFTLVYPFSL
jgi:hypothetical protein